jgi:thymidylate synthase (FAD)
VNIGTDGIEVRLVQPVNEDMFKRVMSMATRATIGLDLTDKTMNDLMAEDNRDWEEMLKGGLQTALETQTIVFAVSGVSRTCTHQLVRSRKASFHQQSQRASYYGDRPEARMPESIWRNPRARAAFLQSVDAAHHAYRVATEEDISYQDARFVLPEGTDNYILLEYSVREFMNVFAYRGCSMFSWEIVHVMRECRRLLVEAHPWIEPYVKISCEKVGRCTFQGWENVEGQCDFPWATEESRTFKPEHHAIAKGKA